MADSRNTDTLKIIYDRYKDAFRSQFDIPLSYCWDWQTGFDTRAFCTQVLGHKSVNAPNACFRKYGAPARAIVRHILRDTAKLW